MDAQTPHHRYASTSSTAMANDPKGEARAAKDLLPKPEVMQVHLEEAQKHLVKVVQRQQYGEVMVQLEAGKINKPTSRHEFVVKDKEMRKLNPFVDDNGILRVGSRPNPRLTETQRRQNPCLKVPWRYLNPCLQAPQRHRNSCSKEPQRHQNPCLEMPWRRPHPRLESEAPKSSP